MATFTNRATLSYNGITTESNTVTGTFAETLAITKTSLTDTYGDGTRLTYVISLINSGITAFTGLTLTDDLGAYQFNGNTLYPLTYVENSLLYYINGALQPTPTVADTQPLTVTGIAVPAGSNVTLVYSADVNNTAPLDVGGEITNTASVTGGLQEPISASETVTAEEGAMLNITKALTPVSVPENGIITYTLTITNTGNTEAVATDNVIVSDTFDPILDLISVTLNGAALDEGTDYTYNEATGQFDTAIGTITVPAATYTQNPDGTYTVTPGPATLAITGRIVA